MSTFNESELLFRGASMTPSQQSVAIKKKIEYKVRKKVVRTKAMEFGEKDHEKESTEADTDIKYNITVKNDFESLWSECEAPAVTLEKIVHYDQITPALRPPMKWTICPKSSPK